jgi:hypothetical protein
METVTEVAAPPAAKDKAVPVNNDLKSTPKDQQIRHQQIIAGHGRRGAVASWSRITPQPTDPSNPYTTAATGHYVPAHARHILRGGGGHYHHPHHAAAAAAAGIKRKRMVCEVCEEDYENLAEHVQSEKHQSFLTEPDNFKELLGVINSLPKLSDLINANLPVEKKSDELKEAEKENENQTADKVSNKKNRRSRKKSNKAESNSNNNRMNNNSDQSMMTTDDEHDEATSAYDVNHIRERMSVATITAPIEMGEPVFAMNNAFDDREI